MSVLARFLILLGVILIGLGVASLLLPKIPGLGRLPGDIIIKRENFTFYFPLGTDPDQSHPEPDLPVYAALILV